MIKIDNDGITINNLLKTNIPKNEQTGAIVNFIGYVRDFDPNMSNKNKFLEIEHYSGMTEKSLIEIEHKALLKWDLIDINIIHRVGLIEIKNPIVFISVSSQHRNNAFEACRFIIDSLKICAPFWKKEVSNNRSLWVEQKESDLIKVKYTI